MSARLVTGARRALVAAGVLLAARAPLVHAQGPAAPAPSTGPREVVGRIVRPVPGGERGVPGVWAVLHRVGRGASGPLDSVRTDAGGRYAFRYTPAGEPDAIHFVSASYAGIAYFGNPLQAPRVQGDDAVITVFDTTSAPVALAVKGRHLVFTSAAGADRRAVVEVFELSNDTTLTRIGGAGDSVTFAVALPAGASDFAGGQGDVTPEAMALVNGRVEIYAPFAPGLKQLSYSYSLPNDAFPLAIPVERLTDVLEVLVEDQGGEVSGARLVKQGPVTSEGRTFVRWLADSVPPSAVVRVAFAAPARGLDDRTMFVIMGTLAAAALALGVMRTMARRRGLYEAAPAAGAVAEDPERIARRIAALDAAFERKRAPGEEERAAYRAEREAMKRELTDALARRDARR